MTQRAFCDANVFYSKTLMDWLFFLRIENEGMFQLHSTEDVFAEVASNMRKNHSRLQGYVVRRRVELMREIVDEVLDTFPSDLPFTGTDEDDYHIHAAATACQADLLLTDNDPQDITTNEEVHYETISPDDFCSCHQIRTPRMLHPIVKYQIEYWDKKPDHMQLDKALRNAGCLDFASIVLQTLQKMSRMNEI